MKILVVDDTVANQESARQTLKDHDLTVVGTYDDAIKSLDEHSFDAVLLDLMMPASDESMGGQGLEFVGQLMPVGLALVMAACRKGGWRNLTPPSWVLVATATNHHHHPASAWLDRFGFEGDNAHEINGAKVGFFKAYHTGFTPEGGKDWGKMLGLLMAGRCFVSRT